MVERKITREEAIELFVTDDWHLAKRQLTWFKRNPNIVWLPLSVAKDYILSKLA
jgi:tRNA A37 N6-isopentenylltransferase MiaA